MPPPKLLNGRLRPPLLLVLAGASWRPVNALSHVPSAAMNAPAAGYPLVDTLVTFMPAETGSSARSGKWPHPCGACGACSAWIIGSVSPPPQKNICCLNCVHWSYPALRHTRLPTLAIHRRPACLAAACHRGKYPKLAFRQPWRGGRQWFGRGLCSSDWLRCRCLAAGAKLYRWRIAGGTNGTDDLLIWLRPAGGVWVGVQQARQLLAGGISRGAFDTALAAASTDGCGIETATAWEVAQLKEHAGYGAKSSQSRVVQLSLLELALKGVGVLSTRMADSFAALLRGSGDVQPVAEKGGSPVEPADAAMASHAVSVALGGCFPEGADPREAIPVRLPPLGLTEAQVNVPRYGLRPVAPELWNGELLAAERQQLYDWTTADIQLDRAPGLEMSKNERCSTYSCLRQCWHAHALSLSTLPIPGCMFQVLEGYPPVP